MRSLGLTLEFNVMQYGKRVRLELEFSLDTIDNLDWITVRVHGGFPCAFQYVKQHP